MSRGSQSRGKDRHLDPKSGRVLRADVSGWAGEVRLTDSDLLLQFAKRGDHERAVGLLYTTSRKGYLSRGRVSGPFGSLYQKGFHLLQAVSKHDRHGGSCASDRWRGLREAVQ
jgi:hypothetical protein